MTKTQLKTLISENRLHELLDALEHYPVQAGKKRRTGDVVVLRARLGLIEKDKRMGVLKDEDYLMEVGKINMALLAMIDEIPEIRKEEAPDIPHRTQDGEENRRFDFRKRHIFSALIASLVIAGMVIVYPLLQATETQLRAEITTDVLSFRLAADWELDLPFPLIAFEAENLSKTTGFFDSTLGEDDEAFDLEIQGDYLALTDLRLQSGSRITIQLNKNDMLWSVSGAPVQGKLDMAGAALQVPQHSVSKVIPGDIPEVLFFASEPFAQFWFSICDTCNILLSGFTIDAAAFEKQVRLNPPLWKSSILEGTVYSDPKKETFLLEPGDWLLPAFAEQGTISLEVVDGQLRVRLEGKCSELKVRKKGAVSEVSI